MANYLMKCGHVAQGHDSKGNPVCVICAGIGDGAYEIEKEITQPTDGLEGRIAVCGCGKTRDSSWNLPFFEYRPDKNSDRYYCGHDGWD